MRKKTVRPYWLEGTEICGVCRNPYVLENEHRCAMCDESLCEHCTKAGEEESEYVCSTCHDDEGDD